MRKVSVGHAIATLPLVVALAAAWAAPDARAASTRYASPVAMGTVDCSSPANACPISSAVTASANGDTIDVLANFGDYNLAAGTVAPGPKALHFVGVNGTPRLIANAASPVLDLAATSSSATNLYIENDGSGDGLLVEGSGGIAVDRLFVKTTGSTTSHTCFLGGGATLSNSVCWQANGSAGTDAVATESMDTVRDAVAWNSGSGSGIDCIGAYGVAGSLTVVNTIARATGAGAADLATFSQGTAGSIATLTATYSNFATSNANGTASMDHFNTDATDQNVAPQLVNPGTGDFRELGSSPTINAGITDPANGTLDLDGNPRTVGGKTDIGAYELGRPATKTTPPHGTTIAKAKISKHKHSASFTFTASGTVTGFQCALVKRKKGKHHSKLKLVFSSCSSPKTYKPLKHGRYTFEVRGFNSAGADPTPAIKKFKL